MPVSRGVIARLTAPVPVPVALAAALVLGGCGGASRGTRAATSASAAARTGPAIFAAACVVCHSLSGRAAPSQQGGDLRGYTLTRAQLESLTRAMPARPALTASEVRTVADYLLTVERRRKAAVQ